MEFYHAFILGVVEGITEFLPISSTGHLILASNLLKIPQTEFVKTFEIAIQSGAILSVIFLYWRTVIRDPELIKRVLVAFIPTAIIGFTLYKCIKQYLIGNSEIVLGSLFLGGIVLIAVELLFRQGVTRSGFSLESELKASEKEDSNKTILEYAGFHLAKIGTTLRASMEVAERHLKRAKTTKRQDPGHISYEKAFVIGLFQSVSIIPGVSRAAATIIGGLLVGLPRKTAVEFSFLLAVPTMIAATALDMRQTSFGFDPNQLEALALGFITSFIIALIAIKWLLKFVQTNTFISFGIYRIAISILYFFLIL